MCVCVCVCKWMPGSYICICVCVYVHIYMYIHWHTCKVTSMLVKMNEIEDMVNKFIFVVYVPCQIIHLTGYGMGGMFEMNYWVLLNLWS